MFIHTGTEIKHKIYCHLSMLLEDAITKLTRMLYNPEFKMIDREQYLTETIPLWLGHFEKIAPPLAKQVIFLASH